MGVMDRFLNVMRLNSEEEDYFDEDYYDEEDEDEDLGSPRKVFRRERKKHEIEQEEPEITVSKESKPAAARPAPSSAKITPMRSSRRSQGVQTAMEVCVIKPETVEDAREITETLLAGRTVVLNLEGLDLEIGQRIIDFTSGSCYAVDGKLQKISNYIFIATPQSVDISGDFENIMSAFDTSSIQVDI
ncbi:MAG: cell division protein SepF [Clostridiales bacterium]|nr:cell division protein SepF [Clostridiales bacterium]